MKRFVRVLVEHFSEEGLEVRKYDEDRAEKLTCWVQDLIDPNDIVRVFQAIDDEDATIAVVTCGDVMRLKGNPEQVFRSINNQLASDPNSRDKFFYVV